VSRTAIAAATRPPRPLRRLNENAPFLLMVLPGVAFFLVFCYLPMFGVVVAFKDYNPRLGILGSPWVGFANFRFFLASQDAWRITRNTLALNLLFLGVGTVFQVGFALMFHGLRSRVLVKAAQSVMFLPHFISWVIAGYFSYAILEMDRGLLNSILKALGARPVMWFNEPGAWPLILLVAHLWKATGYGCVIYSAAIVAINPELYEAATVEGAGRWQQVRRITLPVISPVVVVLTLIALGGIFRADFGLFYNLTLMSGPLFRTTDVMETYVYRAVAVTGDVGLGSAAGFLQAVVGFLLVLAANLVVRRIDSEKALF
jgi:putative aldouronate transport system permease protein